MLALVSLPMLISIMLVGLGLSFVLTGSTIGKPIRVLGWLLLRRTRLDALVRCPPCSAWWCAFAIAAVSGLPWWQWLEVAFATCGLAAIVQAQWALGAHEDFDAAQEIAAGTDSAAQEPQ